MLSLSGVFSKAIALPPNLLTLSRRGAGAGGIIQLNFRKEKTYSLENVMLTWESIASESGAFDKDTTNHGQPMGGAVFSENTQNPKRRTGSKIILRILFC